MPTDHLSTMFSALADPTRRAILARLALGETSVTELAKPFDISGPAISKHLKVLEGAGLITRGREAQWRPCKLEPKALKSVDDWLERYRKLWEQRLDRLEDYLRELQAKEKTEKKRGSQEVVSISIATRRRSSRRASLMHRAIWSGEFGAIPSTWRSGGGRTASA